jgi:tetrahydromethanopterin S-methyltransferase subunit D
MRVFGAVEAGDILEVIWVSLVAAIFVSITYSFVVVGSARSAEARRNGDGTGALVWAGMAVLAFALFAAAVGFGVNIMLSKD